MLSTECMLLLHQCKVTKLKTVLNRAILCQTGWLLWGSEALMQVPWVGWYLAHQCIQWLTTAVTAFKWESNWKVVREGGGYPGYSAPDNPDHIYTYIYICFWQMFSSDASLQIIIKWKYKRESFASDFREHLISFILDVETEAQRGEEWGLNSH